MRTVPNKHIAEANQILIALGLPRAQQNTRSALCLLALLNLTPRKKWAQAGNPLIGITPIMDWAREHYQKDYAPNTRETFRPNYLSRRKTLAAKYAKERQQNRIPVQIAKKKKITLSPGEHSELIRSIIEDFGPRFTPGSILIYAGDTGDKWGYFDAPLLADLGVKVYSHGKMPDVVLYFADRDWLVLVEAVTSHGPVDGKRHTELAQLFVGAKAGLVYVTAFPNRSVMSRYLGEIAWETEVWVADAPSHLIHFDGERFLGPYDSI